MTVTQASPLLSPEEIAVRAGQQIAYLRLPERAEVFSSRALRLRQLAAGHPVRDFLLFAAELAQAQHAALQSCPELVLPTPEALDAAAKAGMAPLPALLWPRDPAWRDVLRGMLATLLPRLAGSPAQDAVRALMDAGDAQLEQQADRLLRGIMAGLDMSAAPLVAAGLQVYWSALVLATQAARGAGRQPPFGRTVDATACPCCASAPTASVTRNDPSGGVYRYLHCSLCATQWHMVRVKCSHCESTKGIHYQSLAPLEGNAQGNTARPAVEAETCDSCRHYLKIVRMERDFEVEPAADDLATLSLDLLVSEAGYRRHGLNLLLLYGEAEDDTGEAA
ncbi:MAG: formate dehydrogenase accessory protein FdhE [Pseudomonadota bacterium]